MISSVSNVMKTVLSNLEKKGMFTDFIVISSVEFLSPPHITQMYFCTVVDSGDLHAVPFECDQYVFKCS